MQTGNSSDNENNMTSNLPQQLSDVVRYRYVDFLDYYQLHINVQACRTNYADANVMNEQIKRCAKKMESQALEVCVATHLYQRHMVQIINSVRRDTEACCLVRDLQDIIAGAINQDSCNKYTQTKTVTDKDRSNTTSALSLKEKFDAMCFDETNREPAPQSKSDGGMDSITLPLQKRKRSNSAKIKSKVLGSPRICSPSKTSPPTHTNTNILSNRKTTSTANGGAGNTGPDDTIERELARLFGDDDNDDPILQVLQEIKNYDNLKKQRRTIAAQPEPPLSSTSCCQNAVARGNQLQQLPGAGATNGDCSLGPPEQQSVDLANSIWPCELFMQRDRLSAILNRLIEKDIRWRDAMKLKFEAYFGEDSDDEFTISSSPNEVDAVLVSSLHRITPWVVKHLMKPFRDGLITDRHVFKKLAKWLSHKIAKDNRYPNERFIQREVEQFFCLNKANTKNEATCKEA